MSWRDVAKTKTSPTRTKSPPSPRKRPSKTSLSSMRDETVRAYLLDGATLEGTLTDISEDMKTIRLTNPIVIKSSASYRVKGALRKDAVVVSLSKVKRVAARSAEGLPKDAFITDSGISDRTASAEERAKKLWNRKLERCDASWIEETPEGDVMLPSEESSGAGGKQTGSWDQFKHFKPVKAGTDTNNFDKKFEEMYSTPLDMNSIDSKKIEFARKKALEISSTATSNPHLAEERGHKLNVNMSSEDRYSGVLRKEAIRIDTDAGTNAEKEKDVETDAETDAEPKKTETNAKKSKLKASSSAFVPSFLRQPPAMPQQPQFTFRPPMVMGSPFPGYPPTHPRGMMMMYPPRGP